MRHYLYLNNKSPDNPCQYLLLLKVKNSVKKSHSVEIIYFAAFTDPIEKINIDLNDHSEYGWFSEDEIKGILNKNKDENDPEIMAIYKGFAFLKGEKLNFG